MITTRRKVTYGHSSTFTCLQVPNELAGVAWMLRRDDSPFHKLRPPLQVAIGIREVENICHVHVLERRAQDRAPEECLLGQLCNGAIWKANMQCTIHQKDTVSCKLFMHRSWKVFQQLQRKLECSHYTGLLPFRHATYIFLRTPHVKC